MESQSNQLRKKAEEEEHKRKLEESSVLNFLHKHSGEYERLQKELAQPNRN